MVATTSLTAWPILDVRGDMVAFSHSVIDITETKRAEEQIRYHADLLQNVSDAIIATDAGARSGMEHAAETIYGWKAEEILGKIFHDIIKPEYRYQSRDEVIEKLGRDGVWSGGTVRQNPRRQADSRY